jgi:hypothetical protein
MPVAHVTFPNTGASQFRTFDWLVARGQAVPAAGTFRVRRDRPSERPTNEEARGA